MTVRDNILAGKYVPALPLVDAPVTVGDYLFAHIARQEVYPVGYDQFAKDEPGKPKVVRIKPTYAYYLDLGTSTGLVRQRINVKDRTEAEELLAQNFSEIEQALFDDLVDEVGGATGRLNVLFDFALRKRLKGLLAVEAEWKRLYPLSQ